MKGFSHDIGSCVTLVNYLTMVHGYREAQTVQGSKASEFFDKEVSIVGFKTAAQRLRLICLAYLERRISSYEMIDEKINAL